MFIRVRDPETRHEFDLPEGHRLIRLGLVDPVKGKAYPPSPRPRRAKHHLSLADRPVPRLPKSSGEGVATEKESHHG